MNGISAILLLSCASWCSASPTTVMLHAHSEIVTTTVHLGEIALIHGDNQEVVRRLEELVLLPAPDLGKSVWLSQVEIVETIRRQTGDDIVVDPKSPTRVQVTRIEPDQIPSKLSSQTLDDCRQRIQEMIKQDLIKQLGDVTFHIRIEGEEAIRHLGKHAEEDWALIAPSQWHEGWQQASIEFPEPEGAVQFPIRIELIRDREVLAVRWTIERGKQIQWDDLVLVSQLPNSSHVESVSDPELVIGMEAKRDIVGGSLLTPRDIGKKPVVFRGQPLTVTVQFGTAWVQKTFLSTSDAGVGDWIDVTDTESRAGRPHDYMVRVTGPHQGVLPQDAPMSRASAHVKPTTPSAISKRRDSR